MKQNALFIIIISIFFNSVISAQSFSTFSEQNTHKAQQWAFEVAQLSPEEQQLIANMLYFSISTAYAGLLARLFTKRLLGMVQDVFEYTFRLEDQLYSQKTVEKSFLSFLKLAADYRWAHDSWQECKQYLENEPLSPQLRDLYAALIVDSNNGIRVFIQNHNDEISAFMYDVALKLVSQSEVFYAEADKLYKAIDSNKDTTEVDSEYDKVNATKLTADLVWRQSWNSLKTACQASQLPETLEGRAMDTLALYYKELLAQMEEANIFEQFGRIMFAPNGIIPEEKRERHLPKILGDEI